MTGEGKSMPLSTAALDVLAERRRQIMAEGWTAEHDDTHAKGEMADAAACYALMAGPERQELSADPGFLWPWSRDWWKPGSPRRMLVKAAALILAEIERIDRHSARKGNSDA